MPSAQSFRSGFYAALTLLVALLGAGRVAAADISYRVEIDAPRALRELLLAHLRIVELRGKAQMGLAQLRREYADAPAEISRLLATEGYFTPEVVSSLDEAGSGWVARFKVQPGEPTRISDVDIDFAGALAQGGEENDALRRRLTVEWRLRTGERFRQADWEAAKLGLIQPLVIDRFPAARITDSEALINPATRTATLKLRVDSGPVFTLGEVTIAGLERYDETVVRRLSPIRPGEEYTQAKLLDFQQRLQETGYFATAVVSIEPDPANHLNVPVRVVVSEARSKKLSFGIGYSTDVGNRISTEYQHANLFDRGLRLRSALRLETRRQNLSAEIQFPRTGRGYDDRISSTIERQDLQGETLRRFGVTGSRSRIRGNVETGLSILYQLEEQQIAGADTNTRKALALNYSWTQRAVDSLLFPRDGYIVNLQFGGAPRILRDTETFVRSYARGNYFLPVGKRGTLLLRAEGGLVAAESRENIPSDFLFRTGGDQSVRGYAFQSIGVKEGDAIVGGRALGVVSAEYAHYFTDRWGAAIFYDAGGATDDRDDFKLNHGYGIGARWRSPIGPLNLDIAYGQEVGDYRIHFSVGLVF